VAREPIENYGIIGNMRTAALVSVRGSIDWFCFPSFDSPSVFGALLDDEAGGRFSICPIGDDVVCKQLYWPDTNVLVTRFLSGGGVSEIQDFMPAGIADAPEWHDQVVRRVSVARGTIEMTLRCEPLFDYGRVAPRVELTPTGAVFEGPGLTLALTMTHPLVATPRGVMARIVMKEGDTCTAVLRRTQPGQGCGTAPSPAEAARLFEATVRFWRDWLSRGTYSGRWREIVNRSALVLKLLTYEPTGAIVAAPTCSLPEELGGVRNWDYRYTWIRDAAFTVYALLRIGFKEEAERFIDWLGARARAAYGDQPLQIVYGIDGRRDLTEVTLDHLRGYGGSRPVRVGNGAYSQLQLDIYGELMDAVYLHNKYGTPISSELWTHLRRQLDWLCDNWRRADEGIWETRGGRQHFVYSKLMCWVAFDRGIRLAEKRSFPAPLQRWLAERDAIYEEIQALGWSDRRKAFVQAYGSERLDASNLIMPLVFFLSPSDPRMLDMLDQIRRSPRDGGLLSGGLVYRYDPERAEDGLTGREGTFNMCTFWLVEALTRAGRSDRRRLEEARMLFEQMLGYASHVGLYAEETGPCGEALGNYPQAFTHLALISAAFNLNRALDERQ
jgi:GH15 family glucan-1,4-alpha-glucosidase